METTTIRTRAGTLDLIPATIDQLRAIARYWPMELIAIPEEPGHFGLVFQHGEQEVYGIKMQPPDIAETDAKIFHHMNRALIASALPYYVAEGHKGVMVPCAYYKEKSEGTVETGIAFFVGPDAESRSRTRKRAEELYDDRLGEGATSMVFDMAGAIARASKECHLPLMTVIGIDLRPRLAIGGLAMHFLVEGPRVFVVQDPLREDEPIWEYAVGAGFSRLSCAPMKPLALPAEPPAETPSA